MLDRASQHMLFVSVVGYHQAVNIKRSEGEGG
jgi:hypothetical protein